MQSEAPMAPPSGSPCAPQGYPVREPKSCAHCGAEFVPAGNRRTYCRPECYSAHQPVLRDAKARKAKRGPNCLACGSPLPSRRFTSCSEECAHALRMLRKQLKRSKCLNCKGPRPARKRGRYCSAACEDAHLDACRARRRLHREVRSDGTVVMEGDPETRLIDLSQHGAVLLWRRSMSYRKYWCPQYVHVYECELRLQDGRVVVDHVEFDSVYASEDDVRRLYTLAAINYCGARPEELARAIVGEA